MIFLKVFFFIYYIGSLIYVLCICGFICNNLVLYMNSLLILCEIFKIVLNCTCIHMLYFLLLIPHLIVI
jgi:hypothetical protein